MNSIKKALDFAYKKHKDQKRKVRNTPYISHILDVYSIMVKENQPEDIIITAILHDVLEDTDTTKQEIQENFGKEILQNILYLTENKQLDWKQRKENTINFLKNKECNRSLKLIRCADAYSNLKDNFEDYKIYKDELWNFFNQDKKHQIWWYSSLLNVFEDINDTDVYKKYKELCENFVLKI